MYGLAAIQQADGWIVAGIGILIVLVGLTILSFLVTLLSRFSGQHVKQAPPKTAASEKAPARKTVAPDKLPEDLDAAAAVYQEWTQELGERFALVDLHRKCKAAALPHPHLSISRFRDAGLLVSLEPGYFAWKPKSD